LSPRDGSWRAFAHAVDVGRGLTLPTLRDVRVGNGEAAVAHPTQLAWGANE